MKKTIAYFMVLSMSLILLPQASADLNDGLVAYYPFNGNAKDESNGYNGTVIGGATLCEDRFGNIESAYCFDGVNGYINIGQQPNFPSWDAYAVSVWFLNDGGGNQGRGYGQKIISKNTWYTDFYLTVYGSEVPEEVKGALCYNTYQGSGASIIDSSRDFRDNAWHHVVINKTGNSGEMWVDGILIGISDDIKTVSNNVDLLIGYSASGDHWQRRYWSGKIDDIRIYNRVLLDLEIQELRSIEVAIDIKPGSCPNPLNLKTKGVLPVAILGTEDFDVTTIDSETIRLSKEGVEGEVAPLRWSHEDVATPFEGELCDCHDLNGDGYLDLTLKFKAQEVVNTLELDVNVDETIPLTLKGNLVAEEDGIPIQGQDCVRVQ